MNEDFAVESLPGDVFQLGNTSYRIMRVERGTVRVEDARGMPPTIPFWLGEAPGRSDELSLSVSRLRAEIAARLAADPAGGSTLRWLMEEAGLDEPPPLSWPTTWRRRMRRSAVFPTQDTLVLERFFDEAGGMQLVIHSPHGSRLNRAWGLALRKRFCRKFNFELQAAGDRGQHRAVAHHRAQLRAGRGDALPACGERAAAADPGAARCADVHHPLALGGKRGACAAAFPRRQKGGAAARAHGSGRPDRGDLP